ncbi:tumor necrosis factor receptor superfamily member 1B [Eublepharis macularius]|uniref:Tumor necrosis factor receptor superfamily member 1B n=1 Tax=Eublepharis macularius TaxID=481883 RepID=A0AA97LIV5_EUBMA|nr:tumor necrosis factor receptor superfamily member 1B [Eublepharis macularius]
MGRTRGGSLVLLWLLPLLEAQGSSLPYRPQSPGQCHDPDEYYNQTVDRCCRFCPPGFRVLHHCNETINTQCEACQADTFTKASNSATRCFGCSPKCRTGLVETQECNRTQDRRCWCPPREFCNTMVFGTCVKCLPYRQCKKGYGVVKLGTKSNNVECAPCERGTFSDVESHNATCRPHTVCEIKLVPGNSTNDAVCRIPITSPHPTVKGNNPFSPKLSVTNTPTVKVDTIQQKTSPDIAYIIGGLTFGLFLVVGFIGAFSCIISKMKAPPCKQPFGNEKQPSSTGKGSDVWPRVSGTERQEEENLLQTSTSSSGSLDHPLASDKSSGISEVDDFNTEGERSPQRSSPTNSCMYHGGTNSKQTGSGGTHVNISCVVKVCNSDHSLQLLSLNGPADADALVREEVPLSKEESPVQREAGKQTAVEVEEDNMDTFAYEEGKPLPMSIQDVGMKTR